MSAVFAATVLIAAAAEVKSEPTSPRLHDGLTADFVLDGLNPFGQGIGAASNSRIPAKPLLKKTVGGAKGQKGNASSKL